MIQRKKGIRITRQGAQEFLDGGSSKKKLINASSFSTRGRQRVCKEQRKNIPRRDRDATSETSPPYEGSTTKKMSGTGKSALRGKKVITVYSAEERKAENKREEDRKTGLTEGLEKVFQPWQQGEIKRVLKRRKRMDG